MANKTFRTDFVMCGKVSPSLKQAQKTVCGYLKTISGTLLASAGIAGVGMAYDTIKTKTFECIEAASNMTETQGKVNQVFKSSTGTLMNWSKTSVKTMGLAQQTALDSAALYGDMATGMKIPQGKAAEMAMTLTKLGADMASFKNISNDMASTALKSIFTGETESLKGLGIVMTQAQLQEFAHSKGIKKKIKDMKESEMVMLRYNFVLSKTKNSQGDFIKTSMNAANQQRMYNEQIKEMQTRLGAIVLPQYTQALQTLNSFLIQNGDTIVEGFEKGAKGCAAFAKTVGDTVSFIQNNWPVVVSTIAAIGGVAVVASFNNIAWAVASAGIELGAFTAASWAAIAPWAPLALAIGGVTLAVIKCSEAWQQYQNQKVDLKTDALKKLTPEEAEKVRAYKASNRTAEITAAKPQATKKHNALGSKNFVGGETWVGEHGPEKVRLPRWSNIVSSNKSKETALSGGGSVIGNMTFQIEIKGNADERVVKSAVTSAVPTVKQQIDDYWREKQRKGLAFA